MSCTDWNGDYLDALAEFAFRDALLCPYQTSIGGPEFATLIFGAIGMALMIRQGSVAIPAVILVVTGGVFVTQIAGLAVGFVTALVLGVLGLAPVLLLRKLSP